MAERIPGVICSTCAFYNPFDMPGARKGQCRRHAPVLDQDGKHLRTIWPLVRDEQWCGEHAELAGD